MENKTFTAGENLVLVEGEILLTGEKSEVNIGDNILTSENKISSIGTFHPDWVNTKFKDDRKILASTGDVFYKMATKKLDRSLFVKPIDVDELSFSWLRKNLYYKDPKEENDIKEFKEFQTVFLAGYNANKAEFAQEELKQGLAAIRYYKNMSIDDVIKNLRPLTLPKQITTDKEYNVIEVLW